MNNYLRELEQELDSGAEIQEYKNTDFPGNQVSCTNCRKGISVVYRVFRNKRSRWVCHNCLMMASIGNSATNGLLYCVDLD